VCVTNIVALFSKIKNSEILLVGRGFFTISDKSSPQMPSQINVNKSL
jgi:hypothetical protein